MAAKRDGGSERQSSWVRKSPQYATPKGVTRHVAGFLHSILVATGRRQNFLQRNAATIAIAATLLVMAGGAAGWILYERSRAVDEGLRTAGNLVHVLEEQVARTIQSVDLTMRGTIDILRLVPPGVVDDARLLTTLRRNLANMPFVRSSSSVRTASSGSTLADRNRRSTLRIATISRCMSIARLKACISAPRSPAARPASPSSA